MADRVGLWCQPPCAPGSEANHIVPVHWYASGSGSWVSLEAPSTPSQPLSEGSHLGLPGLVEVSFSTKTERGGVSSTPNSILLSLAVLCLEALLFLFFSVLSWG